MAEYVDYSSSAQAQSMARNSQYSAQSWVHQNQRGSAAPPPQPVNLPTPVQALRPLPNPHRASVAHTLRVVNTPAPPTAEVNLVLGRRVAASESEHPSTGSLNPNEPWSDSSMSARPRPKKKKSMVGSFVLGFRKLPRAVFGYGAGTGKKKKETYTDTSATDGTTTSVTDTSFSNALPPYRSNPSSPAVAAGPGRSGLHKQYMPHMVVTEPTIPESPPPDVVRLDSQIYSGTPSLRVSPPSGDYGDANFYTDNQYPDYSQHLTSDHYENPADRTTVMLYNDASSRYNSQPVHASATQQRTPSPGLSYVSADPPPPIRPTSHHGSLTPIRIPQNDAPSDILSDTTPRATYASPTPRRVISHSVLAGAPPISSSAPQSQIQTPPPNQLPQTTNLTGSPPAQITSPLSIHPEPTDDYRKMTLLSSPTPTSHETLTSATTYYDPSFTSLNPVERFFKTLYHMPWVSHDRVTVDYLPGETSKRRKRRSKPISSWYHSMFSNNSRRSSVTLDLLSSGTGTATSPGSSLRAGVAAALGSHTSRSRQHRHASDRPKERHQQSRHHHHSSSRHHHSHHHAHDGRKRERYTATSLETANTGTTTQHASGKHVSSPLIPSMYPLQYPPYPYPAFSAFPMPAPAPVAMNAAPSQSQSQTSDRPTAAPRGPRRTGGGHQQHKPQLLYAPPPPGYAPYQPMVGAPQVFLISPTSPVQAGVGAAHAPVPSALVPGGGHDAHSHVQPAGGQPQQPQRQATPGPGQTGMLNIPGAF